MLQITFKSFNKFAHKAVVTCLATGLVVGGLFTAQSAWAAAPTDISGHWAESYINKAVTEGIINGYQDNTFKPDRPVTRAEFISMVNRTLGNTGTKTISFPDVSNSDWYYNDVLKAVAATYVAGYEDGRFLPDNPISRQEAGVMLSRFIPTYGSSSNLGSFTDGSQVGSWAAPALARINSKGYIGAYNDGLLHPEDQLTRAQTAKILCDIKDKESINSSDPVVKSNNTTLSGKIYSNNVTIHSSLGDGSATLDNCVILGSLSIAGGGKDSVSITNSRVANASLSKSDDSVRVVAKGETTVVNLDTSKTSILETSSLSGGTFGLGFNNISVLSSATTTFRGNFPKITVDGSSAALILENASANVVHVTTSGKNSTITSDSKSTISQAKVDSASNFYGAGAITNMEVNSSNVTYETKPRNWTIASGISAPVHQVSPLAVGFTPVNGSTGVKINANVSITFSTAMTLFDGKAISASDIQDFVTIRSGSATGTTVKYTSSIDSARKVITLDPVSDFDLDTRYYAVLTKNAMKDTNGDANTAQTVYFNTEKSSSVTTFSPVNGKEDVGLNTSITITFPEPIVRYSNSATLTGDSYLKGCVELRKTNSSGSTVPFSATINSAKKVITITPDSNLTAGTKYYVTLLANKVKTDDKGTVIPADSVIWTTAGAPTLSEFSVSASDKSATLSTKPNVNGTVYAVISPTSQTAPSAAQIAAATAPGQKSSANTKAYAGNKVALNLSGLDTETNYTAYAVVKDSSGVYSGISSQSFTTTAVNLTSLTVSGASNFTFNPTTYNYSLTADSNTSQVTVTAQTSSGDITINNNSGTNITVNLGANTTSIPVTVQETSKTARTYTITITKAAPSAELESLSIKVGNDTIDGLTNTNIPLTNANNPIEFSAVCKDTNATAKYDAQSLPSSVDVNFTESGSQTVKVTVTNGTVTRDYTITFTYTAPTTPQSV